MVKPAEIQCCEHCGKPDNKKCYTIIPYPYTIIPSMALCEECLALLKEEIQAFLTPITE